MLKLLCIKSLYGFTRGNIYYGHFDRDYNFHAINDQKEEYVCRGNEWSEIFQKK